MRAVAAALALLVITSGTALAIGESGSVTIVDAPRPQTRWGYAPATRSIAAGSWVTWSNDGQDAHTVTAVDGSFDSGELGPSEGFSWYFDQPGTFEYVCTLHPWMTGKVVVAEAGSDQPLATSDQPPPDDGPPEDPGAGSGE
jgi:plastocyanin